MTERAVEAVTFEGHGCVRVDGAGSTLLLTVSTGPRVLGLLVDGDNLFAVVPDEGLDAGGRGWFRFLGGHRLWAAPEIPAVTYVPDDRPCDVTDVDGTVTVAAPPDAAGLARSISVRPADGGWVVDHLIRNASDRAMTIAPWAITQLRPGGEAVIDVAPRGEPPQADRAVVLWPYTDPTDERITVTRDEIRVRAAPGPQQKIGAAPSDGRVRYTLGAGGLLRSFEKRIDVDPGAPYADHGAAVQVYVRDAFCELETLGPLRDVAPGGTATHRERWTVAPVALAASDGRA